MAEIIVTQTGESVTAYVPAIAGAKIHRPRLDSSSVSKAKPVEIRKTCETVEDEHDIAEWGSDNKYPTKMLAKAKKSGLFSRNAMTIGSMLAGEGAVYGIERVVDGKEVFERMHDPVIEEFIEESDLDNWLLEQANDMANFLNCFSLIHLNVRSMSNNVDVIKKISNLEAEYTRLTRTKKGDIRNLYYSPSFSESGLYDKENGAKYKLAYTLDRASLLEYLGDERVFAFRRKYPLANGYYYAVPPFACLFDKDSWLDVAITTPKIINSINKNMTLIKYHIEYSQDYWKFIYTDWDKHTESKKRSLIDEEIRRMNEFLTGIENAGKTFVTFKMKDSQGREIPGCTITPLKNTMEKDAYLPNNTAANAEIVYYQGMDPSLIGMETPGGRLGAGSGSDKRVGWNAQNLLLEPMTKTLLAPLNFVSRFNGWEKDGYRIKWRIGRRNIVTLDNNKETKASDGTI